MMLAKQRAMDVIGAMPQNADTFLDKLRTSVEIIVQLKLYIGSR